tara:strand:- start:1519 stop:2208 length:690 start_codon:yes stop_codon:yes gene_type:complete
MTKILTKKNIEYLIENGYVELPQLKYSLSVEEINKIKNNSDKIFVSNSDYNKKYNEALKIDTQLRDELSNLCINYFKIHPDINDIYTNVRVLRSFTNTESYRGHFDSHIFTLVTPICMPKIDDSEAGQLIVFPKIRKEPKSELSNFLGKLKFYLYRNENGFKNLLKNKKFIEFDFKNLNPILFLGRQSFHGNRSFSKNPEGIRITFLTHFFDPSPKYGIGNILRIIRNR